MTLTLPETVSSQEDLKALIADVRRYAKWYGQTAVKHHVSQGNTAAEPPVVLPAAATILQQWDKDQPITQKSLDKLITALSDIEATAPYVTITLAAPAPNSLKQELLGWFRQHVDQNVLLNLKFNATLLGGMVVSYGSHTYDWSFRRQILAARDKFPEVLRRV